MANGTVAVDYVQSSTTGTPPQFNDGSGTQIGTLCRAWVNFSGSSGTINASFNVSSITLNTSSYYTVNFTSALSDTKYAVVTQGGTYSTTGPTFGAMFVNYNGSTYVAPTTSSFVFTSENFGGTGAPITQQAMLAVFR
jgi:hypothetical protein